MGGRASKFVHINYVPPKTFVLWYLKMLRVPLLRTNVASFLLKAQTSAYTRKHQQAHSLSIHGNTLPGPSRMFPSP